MNINLFTAAIYEITDLHHNYGHGVNCTNGWDYDGSEGSAKLNWEIAFSLSWTSFSTVGFGTVSPAVNTGCFGLRYMCALIGKFYW